MAGINPAYGRFPRFYSAIYRIQDQTRPTETDTLHHRADPLFRACTDRLMASFDLSGSAHNTRSIIFRTYLRLFTHSDPVCAVWLQLIFFLLRPAVHPYSSPAPSVSGTSRHHCYWAPCPNTRRHFLTHWYSLFRAA